jgi:hypothetical protein
MASKEDEAPEAEIQLPSSESVTLTEEDAIGPDDDEGAEPQAKSGQAPPREAKTGRWAQKKLERAREHKEQQGWRQEKDSILARLAAAEARAAAPQPQPQAQPQARPDQQQAPFAAELTEVSQALEAELMLMERDPQRPATRYNELKQKETRLIWRQETALAGRNQPQRQESDPRVMEYQTRAAILTGEFPWLAGGTQQSNDMITATRNYRNFLIEGMKRPDTMATDREAITHVMSQFGYQMPRTAAPARGTYAGPGSRPGGQQNGSGARAVKVDGRLLAGSGLSRQALAQAALSPDDDE